MDVNTIWFVLLGVLFAGYAVLDGFDLGVGILHPTATTEHERRVGLNAIGPIWDGNEVWLLTAGGALFAAFPIVYATVFSGFYLAFMLLVATLMFRAASFEFRGKVAAPRWRRFWDGAFAVGSIAPALLYGVAVGNVVRGLPLDATGTFTGSFLGLLNPYALLVGLVTLAFFTMHGAAFLCLKSDGEHRERMRLWTLRAWGGFVALYLAASVWSLRVAGYAFDAAVHRPLFWIFALLLLAGIAVAPVAARHRRYGTAFLATALTVVAMVGVAAVSLYPLLVPSSTDLGYSLTAYNASSSDRTLWVMLVIALIGMPLVIAYTAYVYHAFKGRVVLDEDSY
jgi:cytochrome d ubiquinol oxidase subunit II